MIKQGFVRACHWCGQLINVSVQDPVIAHADGPYHTECSKLRYLEISEGKPRTPKGEGRRPKQAKPVPSRPTQYTIPGL